MRRRSTTPRARSTSLARSTTPRARLTSLALLALLAACGPDPELGLGAEPDSAEEGKADAVQPTTPQWTVLVYGSYDTREQGGLPSSLGDLKRSLRDTAAVSFLYLEDGPGSGNTRLFKVTREKAVVVKDLGEAHLGTPATLTAVLKLVKAQYPAPRFFLDLIGHTSSGAAAFLPDYTPDPGVWLKQRMTYAQVREAILAAGVRPDVLALSGCGTGDLEIAARFSDVARYVVGLQSYNTGYSDVRWGASLSAKPSIDARGLAWRVAQGLFAKAYLQQGQSAAVGVYDSAELAPVRAALSALAAAIALDGVPGVAVACLGTDGGDGPTPAAGAAADGTTITRARVRGLDAAAYLDRNDSFPFFAALGDHLTTGPTGTNVCDLYCVFVWRPDAATARA